MKRNNTCTYDDYEPKCDTNIREYPNFISDYFKVNEIVENSMPLIHDKSDKAMSIRHCIENFGKKYSDVVGIKTITWMLKCKAFNYLIVTEDAHINADTTIKLRHLERIDDPMTAPIVNQPIESDGKSSIDQSRPKVKLTLWERLTHRTKRCDVMVMDPTFKFIDA